MGRGGKDGQLFIHSGAVGMDLKLNIDQITLNRLFSLGGELVLNISLANSSRLLLEY